MHSEPVKKSKDCMKGPKFTSWRKLKLTTLSNFGIPYQGLVPKKVAKYHGRLREMMEVSALTIVKS